ncbi:MAG: outer membrane beta-barrel protein [Saprospiraceae bacterium]
MNRLIQTSLLLVFPFFLFAQSKFDFGIHLNGGINRTIILESEVSQMPSFEGKGQLSTGFGAGIQFKFTLKDKIFLRSGVTYQINEFRSKIEGLQFATGAAIIETKGPVHHLVLPLEAGINFHSKLYGGGGLAWNFKLDEQSSSKIIHENGTENDLATGSATSQKSWPSVQVFVGWENPIFKEAKLNIEPVFIFGFNKIQVNTFDISSPMYLFLGLNLRVLI